MDPRIGQKIGERYLILERLGAGGLGVVYKAVHHLLAKPYAVKFLLPQHAANPRARARFLREARAVGLVGHQNIVSIHDLGFEEDRPFLVMEYVEGCSLDKEVEKTPGRRLQLARALDLVLQVARALHHAHEKGIIHRDIKPDNMILTYREDAPDWVKLLDFGIAKIMDAPSLTGHMEIIGTPEFMAPEMWLGGGQVTSAVDLYALGITIHDLVGGGPPFHGSYGALMFAHQQQIPPRLSERGGPEPIPPELDELLSRLLDKEPAQRPDAAETIIRLEYIRTLLTPRSLRSLLLARTFLLPYRRCGPDTAQDSPASWQSTLSELDQIEFEIENLWGRLHKLVVDVAEHLWRSDAAWPEAAAEQHDHLSACEVIERRLGIDEAIQRDRIEREAGRRADLRYRLRSEILDLRLQQQDGEACLDEAKRQAIVQAIEERERASFSAEQAERAIPRDTLDQIMLKKSKVRDNLRRFLMQLTEQVLSVMPEGYAVERKRIGELLSKLRDTLALLQQMPDPLRLASAHGDTQAPDEA